MSGKMIGRYEIRGELGRGGMATVYLAYDPVLEREVALKVLPTYFAHEPEFSARFATEAKTVAALEHNAIVSMYDYGEDGEWPYFVMQLMKGGSLKEKIDRGPLSVPEAAKILKRVGSALDRAHSRNLIHRDLKPGNIMFDEDDDAYLTDFGIVKLAEGSENFTQTGNTLGTPAYMSPEQARGLEVIDARSDIYALGVILYEMLTGDVPYKSETTIGQAMMHIMEPIPQILEAKGDLPAAIQAVIDKAMAKKRDERYKTAGELAQAVEDVANGKATAVTVPEVIASLPPEPKPEPVAAPPLPKPEPVVPAAPAPVKEEVVARETAVTPPPTAPAKKGGIPTWVYAVVGVVVVIIIAAIALSGGGDEGGSSEVASNNSRSEQVVQATDAPEPTDEPAPEPTDEPAPEPTDEPAPEPTDEPAPEPTMTTVTNALGSSDVPERTDVTGDEVFIGFDNSNDWLESSEEFGDAGEYFGEAFIDLDEEAYFVVSNIDFDIFCGESEMTFGPGYYSVETAALSGAENNGFGIALNRDGGAYQFLISSTGYASVHYWDESTGELIPLTDSDLWFEHEAIPQSMGELILLEVSVFSDGLVSFSVNEELVAEVPTDIAGEGTVCLAAGFANGDPEDPTVIVYDNFFFGTFE